MPKRPKSQEDKPLVKRYRIIPLEEAKKRLLDDLREQGKIND